MAHAGLRVVDRDLGYKELVKRIFGLTPVSIATGILAKEGSVSIGGGKGTLTLIEVAVYNEWGTSNGHVPERSFIRAWFDESEPRLREMLVEFMKMVLRGEMTRDQVLERMGQYCVGAIQARIAQQIPPPNAPSTIKKKGSSTPLIDTGLLRSSVSYEVREGAGGE